MPFLFPALLWLLPLAAVPVLLHLLTLHRLKTVELSTYRFLFDSYIQQRRRMQFLEALLAVLRTLFIVFVVLMCAHLLLAFTPAAFGGGRHDVVLLVDCSASMNARSGGRSAFDRARSAALGVAKDLGPEDTLTLVEVGARPRERFSRFIRDAKNVEEEIDGLKTTSSRGNVFAALQHVFGPDAPKRANPVVYLFTDCQASGWREVKNQGLEGLIPDKTPFVVVDVGATDDLSNRAVIGDAPRRGRAVAGLPYYLQPRVVNSSKTETADLTLSVFIEEKEVSRTALTLKPGETAVRRIPYVPHEAGALNGRFEISSTTPDRFPDDDRYWFTLNVAPRVKVVVVDGQPPGQPIADVDEAKYIHDALSSTGKSGYDSPDPFDVQTIPEAALTPDALNGAGLAVLANCGGLQGPQFEALRTFTAGGGGLLIFPGDRVNPQVYNDQFFPVPGPQGERLTAARLEAAEGDPDKVDTFEQLGKIDFGHPALTAFDDPDPDARPLSSFRVYKWYKIALPEKKGDAWPLAWLAGGSPALVESRLGDGDVILSAFPAHTRWTNLPTRKDFTPLVMQLANHVARRPPVDAPAVVLADGDGGVRGQRPVGRRASRGQEAERRRPDPGAVRAQRAAPAGLVHGHVGARLLHAEREEPIPGPGSGRQRGVRREPVAGGVGLHDAEQGAAARTIAIREADFRGRHGRRGEGPRHGRAGRRRRGASPAVVLPAAGRFCERVLPGDVGRPAEEGRGGRSGSGARASGAGRLVGRRAWRGRGRSSRGGPIAEHGLHCRGFGGSVGFLLPFVLLLSGGSEGNGSW